MNYAIIARFNMTLLIQDAIWMIKVAACTAAYLVFLVYQISVLIKKSSCFVSHGKVSEPHYLALLNDYTIIIKGFIKLIARAYEPAADAGLNHLQLYRMARYLLEFSILGLACLLDS